MRKISGGLATILALTLAPAAAAQSNGAAAPVAIGRVIEGKLTGDEIRHALTLRAGDTVRISVRSRDFDPMLKVYAPGGSGDALAQDDDSGGGTASELTFTAPAAGTYLLGISVSGTATSQPSGNRAYDLSVVAATAPVYAAPRAITINTGQPTRVNMADCGSGCRFTFTGNEGDRLIAETSDDDSDADPVLELYRGTDKITEDDDSGEGVNARIVRRLDRTATYTVLARTLSGRGTFSLKVSARPFVVRPPATLTVGTPVSATLTTDAETSEDGKYFDRYTLHGRAGQRVTIDMASSAFDTVVQVWADTLVGPAMVAANDDADATPGHRPTTTNSKLTVTFLREGDVELRALSLDHQGAYTLRVSDAPVAR